MPWIARLGMGPRTAIEDDIVASAQHADRSDVATMTNQIFGKRVVNIGTTACASQTDGLHSVSEGRVHHHHHHHDVRIHFGSNNFGSTPLGQQMGGVRTAAPPWSGGGWRSATNAPLPPPPASCERTSSALKWVLRRIFHRRTSLSWKCRSGT